MAEIWSTIREFPNYEISNLGKVRNLTTKKMLALVVNRAGVVHVGLMKRGQQYKRSLPLLVAMTFLPRPEDPRFDTPINLDGDKLNNRADNLMWRPRWFALVYRRQFSESRKGRTIIAPVEEMRSGEVYESSWDAAKKNGILDTDIVLSVVNQTFVWPTYQRFQFYDS